MPIPEHLQKLLDEPVVSCSVQVTDWDALKHEAWMSDTHEWLYSHPAEWRTKRIGLMIDKRARQMARIGRENLLNYHRRMGHNVKQH